MINKKIRNVAVGTICLSSSVGLLGLNSLIAHSFNYETGNGTSQGNDNSYVNDAYNNALTSWGVDNAPANREYFDFKTPDGKPVTAQYLRDHIYSDKTVMVISYKNPNLAQAFGTNASAFNNVVNNCGGDYNKIISQANRVNNLKLQLSNTSKNVVNSQGKPILVQNGDSFSFVAGAMNGGISTQGKQNLAKLDGISKELQSILGVENFNVISPDQVQILISQTGTNEDVSLTLTPAVDNYSSLSKIRITVTDENGNSISNVKVNQGETVKLFQQYNSKAASIYKGMQGSLPSLTKKNSTTFEMDFTGPIKTDWNKKVNTWNTRKTGSQILGAAHLTTTPSSNKIKVKVDVFVDRLSYVEKIKSDGFYPTGNKGETSLKGLDYSFQNYSKSYLKDYYNGTINKNTGFITKKEGKVPNKRKTKTSSTSQGKTTYKFKETRPKFKNLDTSHEGNKKVFNGVDRPSNSADDGAYVRDIWFKLQQYRYWDYKEKPKTINELKYEKYVTTKYNSLGNKKGTLVRFKNEEDRKQGKILTTPIKGKYRKPDKVSYDQLIGSHTWTLAPINGQIRIPVLSDVGKIDGVINDINW